MHYSEILNIDKRYYSDFPGQYYFEVFLAENKKHIATFDLVDAGNGTEEFMCEMMPVSPYAAQFLAGFVLKALYEALEDLNA